MIYIFKIRIIILQTDINRVYLSPFIYIYISSVLHFITYNIYLQLYNKIVYGEKHIYIYIHT